MNQGNLLVSLALFGWIPVVVILFMVLPARRAVITAFLGAWMFLPFADLKVEGLPDYNKITATAAGIFLSTIVFDAGRLTRFRPRWFDLPMAVWCVIPMFSALQADLGPKEGLSLMLNQIISWGTPYFIGRLYLSDAQGLRELGVGLFIGGLVYMPFCWYEIKMSPQLHAIVYGFHQHDWLQTWRSGWRPTVFMQHGLAVGAYMCSASLMGVWIWANRSMRSVAHLPVWLAVLPLAATAILCKSSGATVLMLIGMAGLFLCRATRLSFPLLVLLVIPASYCVARTVGGWSGLEIVDVAREFSPRGAESLQFRLNSENGLWILIQPYLWLGTGRFAFAGMRVTEDAQAVIPDGLWMIALGKFGVIGLAMMLLFMLLPPLLFIRRVKTAMWGHPVFAIAAAWAFVAALYMIDCLPNAMTNPIFVLGMGGLAGLPRPMAAAPMQHPVSIPRGAPPSGMPRMGMPVPRHLLPRRG